MEESWYTTFTETVWHRSWWRRDSEVKRTVDIELNKSETPTRRINYGFSIGSVELNSNQNTSIMDPGPCRPIFLMLDFEDGSCVKPLDYGTFSRWDAIEDLLMDIENDGILVGELWDQNEKMRICPGDWDARVRPGWDIHIRCQNTQTIREGYQTENDSEISESDEEHWADDILDQYREDWCLPRWRVKVEKETSTSKSLEEPSRIVIALGCASVILFIIAVVIYTA